MEAFNQYPSGGTAERPLLQPAEQAENTATVVPEWNKPGQQFYAGRSSDIQGETSIPKRKGSTFGPAPLSNPDSHHLVIHPREEILQLHWE